MQPFPGNIKRAKTGYHPYILNREQKRWLKETFPVTENRLVEKAMGVTHPTLYRIAHDMKLKKSEDGLKAIKQRAADNHRLMNKHERLRLMSGQKQEKCGNIRIRSYTRKQAHCRYRAAALYNYIIYPGKSMKEHDPDRFKIFYDEQTERSNRFEKTCIRYGLKIEPMKQ